MNQEHLGALAKHCRVCGSHYKNKKGRAYSCSERKVDILKVFGIDISEDVETTHPQSYCKQCNNIMYNTAKKAMDGRQYNPRKVIASWSAHSEDNCLVCSSCSTHSIGGRPRKQLYAPGRPAKGSFRSCIQYVHTIAPPTFCQQATVIAPHDIFECPLCLHIVDKPIELACGSLVCAGCLCERLRVSQSLSCPCCHSEHLDDFTTIHPPSEITLRALGNMEVTCSMCAKRGHLRNHKAHVDSMCGTTHFKSAPLNATDLLSIPEDVILTPLEEKLKSKLIKRSMHNSHTLEVKTGGQVRTILLFLIIIQLYNFTASNLGASELT